MKIGDLIFEMYNGDIIDFAIIIEPMYPKFSDSSDSSDRFWCWFVGSCNYS